MSSSVEAQLQATCNALLDIALNTMVGAAEVPISASKLREKNIAELLQWRKHELRLRADVMDYKAAVSRSLQGDSIAENAENTDEENTKLEEKLNKNISKLQDDLFERTSKHQRDELLIRRIIQSSILLSALNSKQQTPDTKFMREAVKSRDQKVLQIVKYIQQLKSMREQVQETKSKSSAMQAENAQLYSSLQERMGANNADVVSSEELPELQIQLETITKRTNILRFVLKSLILESGVNWARHQHLRNFILNEKL